MAEIEFDHITKRYPDGTVAVDDLSLTVADGEFLILVGPSGCGKSTALRMVAGLEDVNRRARSGSASASSSDVPPPDRDIAMVFQSYALYPHMTVARQHRLPAERSADVQARGARAAGERGGRACSSLEELLDRKPGAALRRAAPARGDGARDRARTPARS